MIYVDQEQFYPDSGFIFKRWCHIFTDGDLRELHAFAKRLGLRRDWFQKRDNKYLCHYDVIANKRDQAIALGAKEVTTMQYLRLVKATEERKDVKRKRQTA